MNEQMTRKDQNSSWFSRLWAALVLPGSDVQEAGKRLQAALVAGIALLLAVLSALSAAGSFARYGQVSYGFYLQVALAAVAIPAYILGRSRRYMAGAWLLAVMLFLLGYVDAFSSEKPEQAILFYTPFAFILAIGLFSWRQLVLLAAGACGAALLLPLFVPQFATMNAMMLFGLMLSLGTLAVAVVSVRNAVEKEHLNELHTVNAQMQAMNSQTEQQVNERTRDLSLAAEVGRNISAVQDLGKLLDTAVQLIADRFNLYYTQIYLVDRAGRSLILRAGTGEVGQELIRLNHRLPLDLSSINGSAAVERQTVIVADTTVSPTFRAHPLLPLTRSELAIPLISGERVLGVLDLQASEAGALTEHDLPVFETLAAQLSTALVNAELFERVERSYREMETVSRASMRQGWDEFLDAIEQKDRIGYVYDLLETTPLSAPIEPARDDCEMHVPIKVGGEPVGAFQLAGEKPWLPADREIAGQVAELVAQRVENLRLLQQADRFRREAEATLRRLTHEEWDNFLAEDGQSELAVQYVDGQVLPAAQNGNGQHPAVAFDITVQDEPVGVVSLDGVEQLPEDDAVLAETITSVLGAHLENLRLYSTAQQELMERQRAEQALKESFAQIQESERLTRTVIDSTPDWIFIQDRSHRYRLVNQGYAISRHMQPEDFIGKDDIDLGYPEHVVKGSPEMGIRGIWPDNDRVFQTGDQHFLPNEPVMVDGTMRLFSMLKTPLRDAIGDVIGVLVYARDVTERETILQQTARLYQASRRFSDAHSLNDIVESVCETLALPNFNRAVLMLFEMDEQGQLLSTDVAANWHNGKGQAPFPVGTRFTDPAVLATFGDLIAHEPQFREETDEGARQQGIVSGVSLPLWIGSRFLGMITLQSEVEHHFREEERNLAASIAQQAAVAVESRLLLEETAASEARFRETSNQLSDALDAAKMANWEFDVAAGEFVFNDTFYRFLRTTAEEMGGYRVPAPVYASRFVHPDDGQQMGLSIGQALSTADPNFTQELVSRTILADGEVIWTVVRIAIEKDEEGRTVRIIGANQDVTEQRLASEQIESQRRILQAVLDNMPVGVFMVEAPSGKPILANKMVENFLGRGVSPQAEGADSEELFLTYIAGTDDIYPPEKLPTVAGMVGESTVVDDMEVRKPDGTRVLVQVNGAPVLDENGAVVASVVVVQDITEARKTQELIAKRATELARVAEVSTTVATIQNPEEMLQTVVDLTQQAFDLYHTHIYLLDETGKRLVLTKGAGEVGRSMVTQGRSIPVDTEKSLVARAARTRSGVIVNDVRMDPDFLANPLLPDTRSEMAVPMIAGDRLLGVLDIQDEEAGRFSHEDANIMTTLAAQVAVSLQNARSYARAQRQAEREALINAISERIQATNSVENALQVAVREIGRALGAQHTAVRLGLERKSEDA